MARANYVKAARKAVPAHDIAIGDSYYWWKFRHGGKHYSKTPPKPSQLTQSSFLSTLYAIQESIAEQAADDDLPSFIEETVSALRDLAEECESNRSNMPESLQDSDTGTLLEERAEACNTAADELDAIDVTEPDFEDEAREEFAASDDFEDTVAERVDELKQEFWDRILGEVQDLSIEAP